MNANHLVVFTICSNNYLAQAAVLGRSIGKNNPNTSFQIFLCDTKSSEIDYNLLDLEVTEVSSIEPEIVQLAKKYNIVELNTAVKPAIFKYLFNLKGIEKAIYLDPDTCVFDSLAIIDEELDHHSIIFTPHILTPIPRDGKTPDENLFLNFGSFNLGFLALKNDKNSSDLLEWWKAHTYENGFIMSEKGIFVDQLPMNLAPIFFDGVKVLKHFGCNMAPWNLHERFLYKVGEKYIVNSSENLIFYHFSSFTVDRSILPKWLNRFILEDRSDLVEIYNQYNANVVSSQFYLFSKIVSSYSLIYEEQREINRKLKWQQTSTLKKVFGYLKKVVPGSLKNKFK
ncbi:glycosyltransferase [Pedobacter sp. UBA5917]|jgi:hypothetical protein|uniref:glycosyltransferase n=1 Tax=Pedobacter sp. UBA5917 TaxID=1947061 RepID=UPI0025D014EE|nr:glycosyltransferase [Pedobacter sp. UBA5917]